MNRARAGIPPWPLCIMAAPEHNLAVCDLPADFDAVADLYESTVHPRQVARPQPRAGPQSTPALNADQIDDLLSALGESESAPTYGWSPTVPPYRPPHTRRRSGATDDGSDTNTAVQVAVAEIGANVADLETNLQSVDSTVTEEASATERISEDVSVLREELGEGMGSLALRIVGIEASLASLAETLAAVLGEMRRARPDKAEA